MSPKGSRSASRSRIPIWPRLPSRASSRPCCGCRSWTSWARHRLTTSSSAPSTRKLSRGSSTSGRRQSESSCIVARDSAGRLVSCWASAIAPDGRRRPSSEAIRSGTRSFALCSLLMNIRPGIYLSLGIHDLVGGTMRRSFFVIAMVRASDANCVRRDQCAHGGWLLYLTRTSREFG